MLNFCKFMKSLYLQMAYSKCFNAQTLILCYGNFIKKQNSDCLDIINDLWQLGFQYRKKDENPDFTEIYSFSISNVFVELLYHI